MQLGFAALIVGLVIGLPAGIISALKRNTVYDYVGMSLAILGVSVPAIILGPILQYVFGVSLKWLQVTGWAALPRSFCPPLRWASPSRR